MKDYQVIWFDDEHRTLRRIKESAALNNIRLIPFSNAEEGIKELQDNLALYDAVILDGIFYRRAVDTGDAYNDNALFDVAKEITKLEDRKKIPWFILSGQDSFTKEKNRFADGYNKEVYDKLSTNNGLLRLWEHLKKDAEKLPEVQIRHNFNNAFEIFRLKYLNKDSEKALLNLLLSLKGSDKFTQPKNEFTKLRKIIEKLVDKAEYLKLIPLEVGTANLTRAIGFLCNADSDYKLTQDYFHPTVNFFLPVLVNILQDGSHSKSGMRYKADDFATSRDNGYFFKACMYQMLDVLIAFNSLFQKKEKGELSPVLWKKIAIENLFEGPLEQDERGHYHCGGYKIAYTKVNGQYSIGQQIRILSEDQNSDNETKHLYPKFAVKFGVLS